MNEQANGSGNTRELGASDQNLGNGDEAPNCDKSSFVDTGAMAGRTVTVEEGGGPLAGQEEGGIFSWGEKENIEPWPEPVDGAGLLEALAGVLSRHVVLVKFAVETLALWVLHTYAFRLRDVTTYIGLESPQKRCGKTTLLTLLSELVNRPVVASNISSPAFFRVIEEKHPTLLIDEADTVLHRNDELRGILNSGYKRKTAYVVRVAREVKSEEWGVRSQKKTEKAGMRLARFSSWCPKVIATIKSLPDTLADRCIIIQMHRKRPSDPCERLTGLDTMELRRKCARFVQDHREEIAQAEPAIPLELHDRAGEIWEPLFVLADLAGGGWAERARQAAAGLTVSTPEESAVGALLFDVLRCFVVGDCERIFSRTLVAELNELADRPWGELKKGREVTEQWLARQLRPYGIRPRGMWIGEASAKGYYQEEFKEVFARYTSRSQMKELLEELRASARPGNGQESPGHSQEQNGALVTDTRGPSYCKRSSGAGVGPRKN